MRHIIFNMSHVAAALFIIFLALSRTSNSIPIPEPRSGNKEVIDMNDLSELCETSKAKSAGEDFESKNASTSENDTITVTQSSRRKRSALLNSKWPEGMVPFQLGNHFTEDEKETILSAMVDFHTYTCVRFVPADHSFVKAILKIEKEPGKGGCKSYIGYKTPRQAFLNTVNCLLHGIIQHELMHVLGFDHEHKRPDRDEFVKVHLENVVQKEYYDSFDKLLWKEVDKTVKQTRYDYGSVMHYGWDAFSKEKEKLKTLEALDASALPAMGQRTSLSYSDIKKINIFYGCPDYEPQFAPPITDFGAPTNPFACDFDQDWCGWKQQISTLMPAYHKETGESVPKLNTVVDQFDWLRFKNGTPSDQTGPKSDASGNGHYIYAESSFPRNPGDIARISTPNFTAKKKHNQLCLSFQYHSYTAAHESEKRSKLNVYLLATSATGKVDQQKLFKTKDKDVKDEWRTAKILIDLKKKAIDSVMNIVFEFVMGDSFVHDIAIDEYSLVFLNDKEKC